MSEIPTRSKNFFEFSSRFTTSGKISIQIQHGLGADIIFAFDECTSPSEDLRYQEEALKRTHRWAQRSLDEHLKLENRKQSFEAEHFPQALFGIVQGGRDENLRKKSA